MLASVCQGLFAKGSPQLSRHELNQTHPKIDAPVVGNPLCPKDMSFSLRCASCPARNPSDFYEVNGFLTTLWVSLMCLHQVFPRSECIDPRRLHKKRLQMCIAVMPTRAFRSYAAVRCSAVGQGQRPRDSAELLETRYPKNSDSTSPGSAATIDQRRLRVNKIWMHAMILMPSAYFTAFQDLLGLVTVNSWTGSFGIFLALLLCMKKGVASPNLSSGVRTNA